MEGGETLERKGASICVKDLEGRRSDGEIAAEGFIVTSGVFRVGRGLMLRRMVEKVL